MYDVVCVRNVVGGNCLAIGVNINEFMGLVRVRLVDAVQEKCEDLMQTVGHTVETFPESWIVRIGTVDNVWSPFEVDWEMVEIALAKRLSRQTKELPEPGTIQHVHRYSSCLPSTNFDRTRFQIKRSETGSSDGLFPTKLLPSGYYIGEFLGIRKGLDEYNGKSKNILKLFQRPTHTDFGITTTKKRSPGKCYVDGTSKKTSSFLRHVNQARLWPSRFKTRKVGALTSTRPGVANCEYIQIQDRLYLRTTKPVPPEKELLYAPWIDQPHFSDESKILDEEAEEEDDNDEDSGYDSPDITVPTPKKRRLSNEFKTPGSKGTKTPSTKGKGSEKSSAKKEKPVAGKSTSKSPRTSTTPSKKVSFGKASVTPPPKSRKSSLKKN
eukprot:TRINITY_DN8428_c0_g1_i1.p1 TRINITY_DN8428_c0_g1~~TRINITY_DN8428_c0_g1_i1.p1  ORF type:complete len:395 (+),score=57.85 TRINITY_DN8428_c0_g1_i1:43-1185(+)